MAGRVLVTNLHPALDRVVHVPDLMPGQTLRVQGGQIFPGGKGANVTRVLRRLGMPVECVHLLAGALGRAYASLWEEETGSVTAIWEPEGQTRVNVTLVSDAHPEETHLVDAGPVVSEKTWKNMMNELGEKASLCEWVILAGSLPPGVPRTASRELLNCFQGKKTCLDTSGPGLVVGLKAHPWLAKPNLQEAEVFFQTKLAGQKELIRAIQDLWALGIEVPSITLGSEGAVLGVHGEVWRGTLSLNHIKSTVGCGDAFLATTLWGMSQDLAAGEVLREAMALAGACALTGQPAFFEEEDRRALRPKVHLDRWA